MKQLIERVWFAHFIAILVVCCWGCTFVNTKVLILAGLKSEEIFVLRFLIAYLAIWLFAPKRVFCRTASDELLMVLLGMTGGSLYFMTENEAVAHTYVQNVAFIVCTAPLLTILMAWLLRGSNMRGGISLWGGSLLALSGVALVVFNGSFVLHLNPLGDWLAAAAACCWAAYSLLMKRVTARYTAVFITRKVFFYGLLTALPMFAFRPWQFPLHRLGETIIWGNILFLGLAASFACFFLWNWAISRIGAIKTNNYVYLNPGTAIVAGYLILGERMTGTAWLGSVLILMGIYWADRSENI